MIVPGYHVSRIWDRVNLAFTRTSGKKLNDVIVELIVAKRSANRRPRYVESLRQYLNQFSNYAGDKVVSDITPEDIEIWFLGRSESPSARASNLGRLSSLFSFSFRRGYIDSNPCDRVERVRIETRVPQILTIDQAAKIMQNVDGRWKAYLALALFAGVSPEELSKLQWADVHLDRATVTISAAVSKVHLQRTVNLEPNCVAWLRLGGRLPVPLQARRKIIYRLRFILGWEKWPVDILRHSAATYSLALYQDPNKVAFSLGNSPKILMRHYWSLTSKEDAQAFFTLFPASPAK